MAKKPIALQCLSPWLHLTPTRHQTYRTRWRSDWTPVWITLLLISLLAVFANLFPPIDALQKVEPAVQDGTIGQQALFGK